MIVFSNNLINAQSDQAPGMSKTNLLLEGSTIVWYSVASINLERKFLSSDSEKIHLYGRAGLAYMDIVDIFDDGFFDFGDEINLTAGHLGLTLLTGKGKHHFELSGGVWVPFVSDANVAPIISAGYRFQKPEGGFNFGAKFGILGVGIGLGYAF